MHIYLLLFSSSSLTSVVLNCKTSFIMISIIVVFLCFVFFFFSCCHAVDTILEGHSIQDGQIITSSEETFALGFFSLGVGDESRNRYVGIWYNKISVQTVVWVANRENPIQDRSGNLIIGRDGNLVVLDGTGRSLWSTNVSNVSSNSSVILRDSGNLLLCDDRGCNPGKPLWQSFDEPADTYLPGMRVGLNPRSNKDYFTSWKSETDPSRGNFSLGVDPQGSAEIIIWEGSRKLWRSGLWNAQIFIGVPNMTANILYGFNLVRDRGAAFFTYTVHNSSDTVRFRVRWDGKEEQLLWNEGRKEWTTFWSQPTRDCEHYNRCGNFGICANSNSQLCSCLRGFEPASRTDWDNGNWTGGCVRRTELQCDRNITSAGDGEGDRDRFYEMDGVKLPDFSVSIPTNRDNCAAMCLNNCSCKAYAYVSGIQCLTWSQDFVDIQKFEEGGQTLYIRLAASELGTSKNKLTLVIVLVVVLGAIFIICTTAYIFWRCRGKSGCLRKEPVIVDETKSREFWREFTADEEPVNPAANGPELPMFSLQDIVTATNNFSIADKLGEGGFGPVFKGKLPCGKEVAVKRLSRKSGQGLEEFKNEIILIAKLQHRNLVRLLGYCVEGEEKILLYEYLPNKSLDTFIFANTKEQLNWRKRLNIIEGIARGLLYLHRDSRLRIIHRDLKVSNILLDAEMNPKISDFGMAKIFGGNENEGNTNRVVGTYGYMAPEYAMEGLFSVKSDVYSFGVLLLEIVSGKRNQFRHADYSMNLIGYAWNLWGEERAIEFVDPSIRDSCSDQSSVMRCINVGLLCVQDSPNDRLIMSTVVRMLESDTAILPTPRQPTFTMGRSPMKLESSTDCSEVLTSPNNMTNTMVVGR